MDKQIAKALNKAFHMPMPKENMIGLVVMLVYSKDVFRTNIDVSIFLKKVFDISFLTYAIRSRTLMCAKICRHINNLNEDQFKQALFQFLATLSQIRDDDLYLSDKDYKSNIKSKNAYNNMHKWLTGNKKED